MGTTPGAWQKIGDDCFGSKPDERGHRPGGPHLGVKQTNSGPKQTLPLEGLLSGVERSDRRVYGKEPFSVYLRFEGDSDRISSSGDQGLRGYTEKK